MKPSRFCGLVILATFATLMDFAPTRGQAVGDDSGAARLREVEQAWEERSQRIRSLELRTDIQELVKGRGDRPLDPPDDIFAERLPKEDRTLGRVGYYAYEDGKIAITSFSDSIDWDDPERLRSQLSQVTYDGKEHRDFMQETGLPMAKIAVVEEAPARMYVDINYLAIGLWLFPKEVIRHVGWQMEGAVADEREVTVDGIRCRRIRVPRHGGQWTSALDVDPGRDFVTVQWRTWLNGKLMSKVTIEYEVREGLGAVPTAWKWEHRAGSGRGSRKGTITEVEVNHDVDDRRFENSFPVGTHVIKDAGGKRSYFRQARDGLVPMEQGDYGRTQPAARP